MGHLVIILALLCISCVSKVDSKVKEQGNTDLVNVGVDKDRKLKKKQSQPTQFYIKDEKQYSETFLTEFKAKHGIYETVTLIGDTIII